MKKHIITIKGSSETTREILVNQIHIDNLYWIIGFTEGDGSFFIRSNNTLGFEISQNTKDSQILYWIKQQLGFGKVYHNSKSSISRYVIPTKEESYWKIIALFNNRLILDKRKLQFNQWHDKVIELTKSNLILFLENDKKHTMTWNDAWLSGFIDAEGCFRINYDKTNKRYQLIFQITQDEESILYKIKELLGKQYKGNVRRDRNTFVLTISGKKSRDKLNNYLRRYPLKTKKRIAWLKWIKCERILNKQELTTKDKEKIERLRKTINK